MKAKHMHMTLKYFFVPLVLVVSFAGQVWAAPLPDDRKLDPTVDDMVAALKQSVDLSDEQVQKIRPVFEYNLEKRKEFYKREKWGGNKKKIRQDVRAVRVEVERRVAEILTPEQREKMKVDVAASKAAPVQH